MRIMLDIHGAESEVVEIGYAIYNADGSLYRARTTEGITETPPGSGTYGADVDDAEIAGRSVVWDTGGDTPEYASESFPDSILSGESEGVADAVTLRWIAHQAYVALPRGDMAQYLLYAEEGWRKFVREVGGFYRKSITIPVTAGTGTYALPTDLRKILPDGIMITVGGVTTPLSLSSLSDGRAQVATTGTPVYYFFETAVALTLIPTPSATASLAIAYDAVAPSRLTIDDALPIPPDCAFGLISYAVARMAKTLGDFQRAAVEEAQYREATGIWYTAAGQRTQRLSVYTPYSATPRTNLREEG